MYVPGKCSATIGQDDGLEVADMGVAYDRGDTELVTMPQTNNRVIPAFFAQSRVSYRTRYEVIGDQNDFRRIEQIGDGVFEDWCYPTRPDAVADQGEVDPCSDDLPRANMRNVDGVGEDLLRIPSCMPPRSTSCHDLEVIP